MTGAMIFRPCIGKGTLQSGRVPVCAGNATSGKRGQGGDQVNKQHTTVFDFVTKEQEQLVDSFLNGTVLVLLLFFTKTLGCSEVLCRCLLFGGLV